MKFPTLLLLLPLLCASRTLADPPDILATSDLRGSITGQADLARRAARLQALREQHPSLLLDAGNLFHGAAEAANAPDIIAAAYQAMAYDAINLSLADVRGDLPALRDSINTHQLPVISANLLDADTLEPLFPPALTVTRGTRTYRIIGLTAQPPHSTELPHGIRVGDPSEALARELAQTDHSVIVLFHGAPLAALRTLRPHADRLDAVVLNGQGTASRLAGVPVLFGGERGRSITRLHLSDPDPRPETLPLRHDDPFDPDVARLVSERLQTARAEQQEREAALRPAPPSELPAPGDTVRLLSQTAHQGLGLTVFDWRLESQLGDLHAPDDHHLLVIRAAIENRIHPRLPRDLDYPEAVQVATLENKLFLAVNHRRLIRHNSSALKAPNHLPNQFRIREPGRAAEGTLVFFLPDEDIHHLDLLLYHDEFPVLETSLLATDFEPASPPQATGENEVATLELHGVDRSPSPREGHVRLTVDLRGQSRMTRQADSAALDPSVPTDQNAKVPHAIPADYHYFPDLIALGVANERSISFKPGASEFPDTPVLPPDRTLGGRLVFDLPEAYADHQLALNAWFPTMSIAGERGGGGPVSPAPISLPIQEGASLPIPAPLHSMPDGDLALHLLDIQRHDAFHGLPAPDGNIWISALLRLENRSDTSGLMPMSERFGLSDGAQRIPFHPEHSRLSPFHPPQTLYLPAGQGRIFEVVFPVPDDLPDWTFDYRGISANHRLQVRPTEDHEPPVIAETETLPADPQTADPDSPSDFTPRTEAPPLPSRPIPATTDTLSLTPTNLPEDPEAAPLDGGLTLDFTAENRALRLSASHVYFFDHLHGSEVDEGDIVLGIRLQATRLPDATEGELDLRDLPDRLFGVLNTRKLTRWNTGPRRNPLYFDSRLRLPEAGDTQEGLVFFQVPAEELATFELHWLDADHGNMLLPILPAGQPVPPHEEPFKTLRNRVAELELHGMEFRDTFLDLQPEHGAWLVFDLRGRGLRSTAPDGHTDPVPLPLHWRDWQPRTQIVIDGLHAFPLQREGTPLSRDPLLFLPDRSVGGEIAFDLPPDLLENAQSAELLLGFPPFSIPGERVSVPKPLRFTLKGEAPTIPPPDDPLLHIDDFDLAVDITAFDRRPDGRIREWITLDAEIQAKAEEGVLFTPDEYLNLTNVHASEISANSVLWSGAEDDTRAATPLWIPHGARRKLQIRWRPRSLEGPVLFRYNGMMLYQRHQLEPIQANQLDEPLPNPHRQLHISERGRLVYPENPDPKGIAGVGLEPEQVNTAIDMGRDYLWRQMQEEIAGRGHIRPRRYNFPAVYALVHCDAHKLYPEFDDALRDFLRRAKPDTLTSYENGLLAMILRAYGESEFLHKLEQTARYYVEAQGEQGTWTYTTNVPEHFFPPDELPEETAQGAFHIAGGASPPEDPHQLPDEPLHRTQSFTLGEDGDNSTTQFAVLGLWSAQRAGIEVAPDLWRRTLASATQYQNFSISRGRFGGYGYKQQARPSGSMTAAVICTTAIAMRQLDSSINPKDHLRIRNGLDWLVENFSIDTNLPSERYNYYYLYSLERVGQILGTEFIGEHEWYPLGARHLVDLQRADGSWPPRAGESDTRMTTSLALLFLIRATPGLEEIITPEPEGPGTLVTSFNLPEDPPSLYFIFDASGSMRAEVDGESKFNLAREALQTLLGELPDGAEVALRVFGHRFHALHDRADEDTELVIPRGPLNLPEFTQTLQRLRPRGKTPLALTLDQAARDLRGRRSRDSRTKVIMFTDGAEDTREDPVEAARNFAENTDVEFFMLGFDIENPVWLEQLNDIASTAGGLYHNVQHPGDLLDDLRALVHPPAPNFKITDKEGTLVAQGTFGGEDIELDPGEYRIRADLAGQVMDTSFWIRPGGATRIAFDWAQASHSP